jgi:ribA/ribD-fused uncharacterized protein
VISKKHLNRLTKRSKNTKTCISCGTNDIVSKKGANKIAQDFQLLLQLAKEKAENIHVCSVIPRTDGKVDSNKIDNLNQLLKPLADDMQVKFINNDNNFKYQDGTADETTLLPTDKLHLSAVGSGRLLLNMKLQDKAKVNFGDGPACRWQNNHASDKVNPASPSSWNDPLPVPPAAPAVSDPVQASKTQVIDGAQPVKFRGSKCSFSNFFSAPLRMWGIQFPTNEHAYNYRKAIEMGQHTTAEAIRHAPSPRDSQLMAQSIQTNERWKSMKQSVMYELLQKKALQCASFREDLQASQGKLLIEDTAHEYWGRGQSGTGLNMLGRLIMTLRDNLPPSTNLSRFRSFHHERNSRSNYPRRNDQQPRCFNCFEKSRNADTCRHSSPLQCYASEAN